MGHSDPPSSDHAAAPDAAAQVSKRAAPKISTKLMGLKFMQRAQAKKELSIQEKATKKALEQVIKPLNIAICNLMNGSLIHDFVQERFQLESKQGEGCVVVVEEAEFAGSGRISFQNFNPDVEKVNEEHAKRIQERATDAAEKADVSETEMAQVLGKRKQVKPDENDAEGSGSALAGSEPSISQTEQQPVSRKPPSATVVIQMPSKDTAKQNKPAFRSISEQRYKKKGRVS